MTAYMYRLMRLEMLSRPSSIAEYDSDSSPEIIASTVGPIKSFFNSSNTSVVHKTPSVAPVRLNVVFQYRDESNVCIQLGSAIFAVRMVYPFSLEFMFVLQFSINFACLETSFRRYYQSFTFLYCVVYFYNVCFPCNDYELNQVVCVHRPSHGRALLRG